jgi:hypothetical protein
LKFKKDGIVRYWDCLKQSWNELPADKLLKEGSLMNTFNKRERAQIESAAFGQNLQVSKRLAKLALKLDDGNGILAAEAMLKLTDNPKLHTHMKIEDAAKVCGFYYALDLME